MYLISVSANFRSSFKRMEADYRDITKFSEVRCLSQGKILKKSYDFKIESSHLWNQKENFCQNLKMKNDS